MILAQSEMELALTKIWTLVTVSISLGSNYNIKSASTNWNYETSYFLDSEAAGYESSAYSHTKPIHQSLRSGRIWHKVNF